jgi:hypothetical protein
MADGFFNITVHAYIVVRLWGYEQALSWPFFLNISIIGLWGSE